MKTPRRLSPLIASGSGVLAALIGGCAAPPSQPRTQAFGAESTPVATDDRTVAPAEAAGPKASIFDLFRPRQAGGADDAAKLSAARPAEDAPKDPQPAVDVVFHVEVYQVTLPYGSVSQNPEFWQKLNEQLIDPATYDVLQRNGIRVGEASFTDWEYFRNLIQQNPGTAAQAVAVAREQRNMQLEMRKDIITQDIFHFDRRNTLTGRTYDRSTNIISVSFEPTPRRPGSMRLTLSPIVKSQRKRLEFSVLNDERAELALISPEMIYDCNLRLDVPLESFIVVAPSPEASWPLSVGNAFFVRDGKSQREEQILIIVPKPFRTGGPSN